MWTTIISLLALAAGLVAGWRAAGIWINKKMLEENIFLREQESKLKELIQYWAEQASYKNQIQQTTITNHNSNLENTISTITTLLENLKKEEQHTMKQEDKQKVSNLIERIRGIAS